MGDHCRGRVLLVGIFGVVASLSGDEGRGWLVGVQATKRSHNGMLSIIVIGICAKVDSGEFVAFRIVIAVGGVEVVPKLGKECDVEGGHHLVIFVYQIVAVELQWDQ